MQFIEKAKRQRKGGAGRVKGEKGGQTVVDRYSGQQSEKQILAAVAAGRA